MKSKTIYVRSKIKKNIIPGVIGALILLFVVYISLCKYEKSILQYMWNGKELFMSAAESLNPVTDKVTIHTYQIMYGRFLLPYYYMNPSMKMLEIGLGCDMTYGPGASVAVWKKLFPKAEIWEAETDHLCVEKHKDGILKGINILVGDQGNDTVLDSWIEKSGSNFDVIIDDGGHKNCQIYESIQKLWGALKPGGLYFIEDLQVAKLPGYRNYQSNRCDSSLLMPDVLKKKIDELVYDETHGSNVEFIFCQSEACVVGKKPDLKRGNDSNI